MKNDKILTIPNLLSLLRLIMIPQLMWLYLQKQDYLATAIVLAISGATDVLDGIIARKFNMISDFGKVFDPVADKLTQLAMLYCVCTTHPEIHFLLILLLVKEVITGAMSLYSIRKTGQVQGAEWHGKMVTVLLYMLIADCVIPGLISDVLIFLCAGMMIISMVLYWQRNWRSIQERKHGGRIC